MKKADNENKNTAAKSFDGVLFLRRCRLFFLVVAPVLILDQWTKAWVLRNIMVQPGYGLRLEEPYALTIVPKLLAFIHTKNTGSAFSLFDQHPEILTIVAALLSVGVLVWALFFIPSRDRLGLVSLALIFGGAMGNLIDRFLRDYEVTDFILVLIQYKGRYWPTFNVADVAICVGIGLFMIATFLEARREKKQIQATEASSEKK
ncbi:MAG: signal peptidase II [Candidatus Sumerlaeia bacterium]